MRDSIKKAARQVIPPVLLSLRRAMIAKAPRTSHYGGQHELMLEHERLNGNAREGEMCLRPGLTIKLHPESRGAFEAFCFRCPEMVAEMNCFMKHTQDKHNFLDVGALHGIFSLVFSSTQSAKMSVAVDASPLAFARLLYNTHKNKPSNILPIECALSDEAGVIRMHYEWEHAVAAGTTAQNPSGVSVERKSGDSLCASLGFNPDAIKIDVEGHEVKVLKGLRTTIKNQRPLIFLEVHPVRIREEGDQIEDLESMFAHLNYRLESVTGEPLSLRMISSAVMDQRVVLLPN